MGWGLLAGPRIGPLPQPAFYHPSVRLVIVWSLRSFQCFHEAPLLQEALPNHLLCICIFASWRQMRTAPMKDSVPSE